MSDFSLMNIFKVLKPFNKNERKLSKNGKMITKIDNGNKIIDTKGTTKTLMNGLSKLNSKLLLIKIGKLAKNEIKEINNNFKK